ncbi:hypothetical protein OF83DRAFT_898311 [Amylostereum chailletii]|nr:hypothetical protein OF83DRAFT_898311 [Amylostereum chailletii]
MPKRSLQHIDSVDRSSDFDYWVPTPSKRPHLLSTPAKSTPGSSSSVYSTPYAYSVPSDSPSNPFGFKRTAQKLVLPKATSFSRHLPLRFQLASAPDLAPPPEPSRPPRRDRRGRVIHYDQEGTYRIVQVPLSYTLRHLRHLILFLFNGDPTLHPPPPTPENPGYLFEAQRDVAMYAETHRPGCIKRGKTFIKASTVQDPYYSSQSIMDLVENSESIDMLEDPFLDDDEWTWEGEEDVTLKTVWPDGADLNRGIIYRHDPTRAIHVTMCTQSIPARKGVGNKPFVFRAFGTIDLDPPVPPPVSIFPSPFKKPTSKALVSLLTPSQLSPSKPVLPTQKPASKPPSRAAKPPSKPVASGSTAASGSGSRRHPFPPPNPSPTKPPSKPQPPPTERVFREQSPDVDADADADAEGSDDPDAPSDDEDAEGDFEGGLDPRPWNDYEASPLHLPCVTPAPTLAVTRLRVARVSRRIQRLVRNGFEEEGARERAEREERERDRRRKEGWDTTDAETDEGDGVVIARDWDPFEQVDRWGEEDQEGQDEEGREEEDQEEEDQEEKNQEEEDQEEEDQDEEDQDEEGREEEEYE